MTLKLPTVAGTELDELGGGRTTAGGVDRVGRVEERDRDEEEVIRVGVETAGRMLEAIRAKEDMTGERRKQGRRRELAFAPSPSTVTHPIYTSHASLQKRISISLLLGFSSGSSRISCNPTLRRTQTVRTRA